MANRRQCKRDFIAENKQKLQLRTPRALDDPKVISQKMKN